MCRVTKTSAGHKYFIIMKFSMHRLITLGTKCALDAQKSEAVSPVLSFRERNNI